MATLRGWAPCGTRLIAKVPHGHWKTTTFLAALRHDRIEAPWVLDGPIDGESFTIYVEKVLVPTLQPGDIVIMDNLGSHKGKAVRALIRSRRRQAVLPAEILARPEPHRAGLRQAQAPAAQSCRANRRGRLGRNRPAAPSLHTTGMRQLLRKRRICPNLNSSRSRSQDSRDLAEVGARRNRPADRVEDRAGNKQIEVGSVRAERIIGRSVLGVARLPPPWCCPTTTRGSRLALNWAIARTRPVGVSIATQSPLAMPRAAADCGCNSTSG